MNKRSKLLIAGGVIVAGVAAYGIYKMLKMEDCVTDKCHEATSSVISPKVEITDSDTVANAFEETQAKTVSSIKNRHAAAAQQMKTSLSDMAADCAAFEEKISQANEDLDELLK